VKYNPACLAPKPAAVGSHFALSARRPRPLASISECDDPHRGAGQLLRPSPPPRGVDRLDAHARPLTRTAMRSDACDASATDMLGTVGQVDSRWQGWGRGTATKHQEDG